MSNIGESVYTGMAEYGKVRAIIGTVIGSFIGIGLTVGGVALVRKKARLTSTVGATVTSDPVCHQYQDQSLTKWRCSDVQIAYKVADKDHTLSTSTDSTIKYYKGMPLSIYYDPSDPSNASLSSDNIKPLGWILLVAGILILIGVWTWLFVVLKFKVAAAASGAEGVISTIGGAFKR